MTSTSELTWQQDALGTGYPQRTIELGADPDGEGSICRAPLDGFPVTIGVTIGWLNAIRRGHAELHRRLDSGVPSLVLRSTRAHFASAYSAASDRADSVLDVRQIARWAGCVGGETTVVPIDDAQHDVYLSLPLVRRVAYERADDWLRRYDFGPRRP